MWNLPIPSMFSSYLVCAEKSTTIIRVKEHAERLESTVTDTQLTQPMNSYIDMKVLLAHKNHTDSLDQHADLSFLCYRNRT